MADYDDIGSMITDLMPNGLTPGGQKFFVKWFRKFHLNNNKSANSFKAHSKKIGLNQKNFKDALWAIGQERLRENNHNLIAAQKRTPEELLTLMRRIESWDTESCVGFLLDEVAITTSISAKNRSISNAIGYLEKLLDRQGMKLVLPIVQCLKTMKSVTTIESEIIRRVIFYCDGLEIPNPQKNYLEKLRSNLSADSETTVATSDNVHQSKRKE